MYTILLNGHKKYENVSVEKLEHFEYFTTFSKYTSNAIKITYDDFEVMDHILSKAIFGKSEYNYDSIIDYNRLNSGYTYLLSNLNYFATENEPTNANIEQYIITMEQLDNLSFIYFHIVNKNYEKNNILHNRNLKTNRINVQGNCDCDYKTKFLILMLPIINLENRHLFELEYYFKNIHNKNTNIYFDEESYEYVTEVLKKNTWLSLDNYPILSAILQYPTDNFFPSISLLCPDILLDFLYSEYYDIVILHSKERLFEILKNGRKKEHIITIFYCLHESEICEFFLKHKKNILELSNIYFANKIDLTKYITFEPDNIEANTLILVVENYRGICSEYVDVTQYLLGDIFYYPIEYMLFPEDAVNKLHCDVICSLINNSNRECTKRFDEKEYVCFQTFLITNFLLYMNKECKYIPIASNNISKFFDVFSKSIIMFDTNFFKYYANSLLCKMSNLQYEFEPKIRAIVYTESLDKFGKESFPEKYFVISKRKITNFKNLKNILPENLDQLDWFPLLYTHNNNLVIGEFGYAKILNNEENVISYVITFGNLQIAHFINNDEEKVVVCKTDPKTINTYEYNYITKNAPKKNAYEYGKHKKIMQIYESVNMLSHLTTASSLVKLLLLR